LIGIIRRSSHAIMNLFFTNSLCKSS